jgi:uncharacterized protein (TIGR02301 family)
VPAVAHNQRCGRAVSITALRLVALAWLLSGGPVLAADAAKTPEPVRSDASGDSRPYDDRLVRLSEVLGAVHYMRELCGATDGQLWRDKMRELIDADKGSALRRLKLTKSFNHGYRNYRRAYPSCTPAAQTALSRFLSEGGELSDSLAREQ